MFEYRYSGLKKAPIALLDSGELVKYDEACLEGVIPEYTIQGIYIGSGIIYEVNGVKQIYTREIPPHRYNFYIYEKDINHKSIDMDSLKNNMSPKHIMEMSRYFDQSTV